MSSIGGVRTVLVMVLGVLLASAPALDEAGVHASAGRATGPGEALPAATVEFNERKDQFIDAVAVSSPHQFDHDAAVGLLLLERARRTGDHGDVEHANELVLNSLRLIEASLGTDDFSIQHGAAFTFIRLVEQFGDDPDLLFPETVAAIVRGEFPDGSVEPEHSLLVYRDQLFLDGYDAQNVGLDVRTGKPWDPATYDEYNGTENHKLQSLVAGMLLSEIYAGDVVGDVPVKDDTDALDDQWHYFRDAFLRYSAAWADGSVDHLTGDVMGTEDDSTQYIQTYLGDYLLLRDLYSDPLIQQHAELLIDRILADWAEDLVGPLHTGPVERVSDVLLEEGLSYQEHVINYLLFDNLGGPLRTDSDELFNFGGWGQIGVATTDYVPGSPGFPMVVVDLARNKDTGYTVREGGADHNRVESDFALGFRLDGRLFNEDMIGGFQVVAEGGGATAGRMVTTFHGETPFSKEKPTTVPMGVQSERTALFRTVVGDSPAKLWVQSDLANVVVDDGWLFVEQPTWSGRTVYLGVGATGGTMRDSGVVDGGALYELEPGVAMVWEVATSEDVADFDEFQQRLRDAELNVDGDAVDYVSPLTGVSLHLEDDPTRRTIDGEPVDWTAYEVAFSTPWGQHHFGATQASISYRGQSVTWDWDPDGSGTYDGPPVKQVFNATGGARG